MSAAPRSDDPRPEPPDYSAVPFTGNYSDVGAEEELRRDYERELAEWEARQATAAPVGDADYSPEFQDEYQRLWHEVAAERDRLRAALKEILDTPANATVLNVQFIAREALNAR